jgi:hypothetical protein
MILTKEKLNDAIEACENELFSNDKISYSKAKNWTSNFPSHAGIYAIFDNNKFIYVGETADIKERMKDVRRTINHTFRRKLGKKLYGNAVLEKGKFDLDIENRLHEYCIENISFAYVKVNFGRLEIESSLIHTHKGKGLLNSIGKRNKIDLL